MINKVLYLILSLFVILSQYSCSSEKTRDTEMAKQGDTEGGQKQSSDAGLSGDSLSGSVKGGTKVAPSEQPSKNNPPTVEKAKLQLETRNNIDIIKVVVEGKDKDGDPVTFKYEWTKNGEPAGGGDALSGFKRGDTIAVKITPFDGKEYGHPKVLTTVIQNTTPKIIEHREITFDGKTYTYQVKAVDPDGDALRYKLKQSPQGMTIDESTGLITWKVRGNETGKNPVTVLVSDGNGGEAVYDFEVTIDFKK
jgi:hypothetical protein